MKRLIALLSTLVICSYGLAAQADNSIVVVANIKQSKLTLSKQEIRNLFMGGAVGHDLIAVELPQSNEVRVLFNTKVIGLTEARIQSYWAQMRFSGRKKPPKQLSDAHSVLAYLKQHEGAIAYLPADETIPPELTVVYRSE